MALETLQKFSQELKASREEKGISLSQISNRTKIDIKFLHAIEDARFDVLPDLYMRAFIREYSQTIEVNPKLILEKFDLAKSGKQEIVNKEEQQKEILEEKENTIVEKSPEESNATNIKEEFNPPSSSALEIPKRKNILSKIKLNYIIGMLVLLVAGGVAYYAFVMGQSNLIVTNVQSSDLPKNNKPRYEVSQPVQTENQSTPETQTASNAQAQIQEPVLTTQQPQQVSKADSLRLSVQATDRVWIKIYQDGKVVYQQMAEKGTNIKYRAKNKFSVSVGNAGAVKIFYNDKLIPNIGKTGESRNIYMAPDGIRYYTFSGNEKKSTPAN